MQPIPLLQPLHFHECNCLKQRERHSSYYPGPQHVKGINGSRAIEPKARCARGRAQARRADRGLCERTEGRSIPRCVSEVLSALRAGSRWTEAPPAGRHVLHMAMGHMYMCRSIREVDSFNLIINI